jgi:hypothetical protein
MFPSREHDRGPCAWETSVRRAASAARQLHIESPEMARRRFMQVDQDNRLTGTSAEHLGLWGVMARDPCSEEEAVTDASQYRFASDVL